jgi:L-ascorbate metabolism protein UlaG (beta-lactamase superfamily)
MDLQYFGANCLRLTTKKANIVIDDNLTDLGSKKVIKAGEISLLTNLAYDNVEPETKLVINQPGEFEVSGVAIIGVAARAHDDEAGKTSSTIFKIEADDIKLVVVGNIYPGLSDAQLELLGEVDVLVIPTGGGDLTLKATDALELIKKIKPSVVIPTHYDDKSIKYSSQQASIDEVSKDLAMEISEKVPKLKLKSSNFTEEDAIKLVVLEA